MSYPHIAPETIAECTQAAYDHDPACYCTIHWNYRDAPPARKYLKYPSKWLEVCVWRSLPEGIPDRFVLAVAADNGPELLRHLRGALTERATAPPPRRPLCPAPGNGWIGSAPQTTQELRAWPTS